ncbi:outer membrane protein assembly factor BamB family protein [Nocardiopsis kunsanensis]|uniref:outer membrane protein assembly factor BamB family protein n=1 Tax=Nocardiopsis kunsanensis TaxID=141693 RepID=UPI00034D191C|nr:PQQ-binding-like beta-propeller repeat protein [Nocardiopsis kunsanensis]
MKSGRSPYGRWILPSLVMSALVMASACTPVGSDSRTEDGDGSEEAEGLSEVDEFLPALEFDRTGAYQPAEGGSLPRVDIHGPVIVHASEHALTAHDVVNDERLWSVSPVHGEVGSRSVTIAEHGENIVAVGAFGTTKPGAGTTRDTPMREVLAIDLLSGETLWHETTEVEDEFYGRVVGSEGDSVILSSRGALALDIHDGSRLWSDAEVDPRMVGGNGVVVATSEVSDSDLYDIHRLHGLDAETGGRVWETWEEGEHETHSDAAQDEYSAFLDTDPDPGEMVMEHGSLNGYSVNVVQPAGPGRFYVTASNTAKSWDRDARGGTIALFDADTGVADYSINHDPLTSDIPTRDGWGGATCSYDQETSLACWLEDHVVTTLVNIDPEVGESLWYEQFSSDSERRFTEPVSAWHGVLYARVEGEPIILDLEDGSDLVLDPGAAPDLTNGTIAVEIEIEHEDMETDHGILRVFPVTG